MKISIGLISLLVLVLSAASQAAGAAALDESLRDGSGAPRPLPKPAIVLFWAEWCAPCRLEVRMLPELVRAAGQMPVIVIPMEANRTTRELLSAIPTDELRFAPSGAYGLLRSLAGDDAGLPVSVAIDHDGATCAVKQGPITTSEIRAWARQCGALSP